MKCYIGVGGAIDALSQEPRGVRLQECADRNDALRLVAEVI